MPRKNDAGRDADADDGGCHQVLAGNLLPVEFRGQQHVPDEAEGGQGGQEGLWGQPKRNKVKNGAQQNHEEAQDPVLHAEYNNGCEVRRVRRVKTSGGSTFCLIGGGRGKSCS